MIERSVKVSSILDPAEVAILVQKASQFKSRISLSVEEKTANAKSMLGIISLNLQHGQSVQLTADGEDEQQALPELEQLIQNQGA